MSLKIIKNGTIVTAAETYSAEILINGEVIEAIGRDFERLHPEAEVIDAAGKYVFPGGIDPHVHLDLPMPGTVSSDDHYTGTKAAAFGGTTTVKKETQYQDSNPFGHYFFIPCITNFPGDIWYK